MRNHGLFGEKLSHSISPEIQKYIYSKIGYDGEYSLIEFEKEEMQSKIDCLRNGTLNGANVTIPYKEYVIPFLDDLDEKAKNIGAVNTISLEKDKLVGYNTDYYGIRKTFEPYGNIENKDYIILGYGGASKPLIQFLADENAGKVYIASRSWEKYKDYKNKNTEVRFISYDEIKNIGCEIMVNTTPVGMFPNIDKSPIYMNCYDNKRGLIDFIYNPYETMFLKDGAKRGLTTQNGLKMLVYQAIESAGIWSGKEIDEETQLEIYLHFRSKYADSETIYLVGLPGSGKTTVGKIVAEKIGYKFIDLDEYIEKSYGMSVKMIFEKYGEKGFRNIETEALKKVSNEENTVISTGGGTVISSENRDIIKKSEKVIFIDRECKDILADVNMKDRPLLKNTPEKLYELRDSRINFYEEVSTFTTKNNKTVEKLSMDILSCL